ncbi:MAG: OmpH family outer membrane protein, partial [Rhodospirillales bacterium]
MLSKSITVAVILAALSLVPVRTAAAQADGPKAVTIALIDYQRLLRDSKAMQDAANQINAKGKELEGIIKKRQQELQAAETELKRQRTVLSPEAFQKRRADFEKDVAEFNRLQKRSSDQITIANQQSLKAADQQIFIVAQEIAKANNITPDPATLKRLHGVG